MGRALLILFAVLIPAAAVAAGETLPVRAGEHGEYSRLVIPNAPAGWRIATSDRKIEVTFPNKNYGFDLSEIVDKRKAHRILNARLIDGEKNRALVLSLTCDCPVRTSKSAGGSIIIDIFNKNPAALAEEADSMPEISDAAKKSTAATPESMRAARDRMIALLAEARHQGVVQLKIDEEREPETAHEEPAAPQPATPVTQASLSPESFPPPDANNLPQTLTAESPAQFVDCVDPALFNEPQEGEGEINIATITSLRRKYEVALNDEERDDLAATLALAYLHIGFFEEASAIATPLARKGDANMAVAGALADIATGAKARAARLLAPHRECGAFYEAAYAAAAQLDDETVSVMQAKHVEAIKPITRALRAPLAEALGLNALEHNDLLVAQEFYDIAKDARGDEHSPALVIMENVLAGKTQDKDDNQAAEIAPASKELVELAQTPGPLQARALAILAEDYQKRADAAYEGLLDDIASQSSRKGSSLSEARAAFTGAKALVSAGRLREGVNVLSATAKSSPAAYDASQALARSIIMNALLGDEETRLDAIAAFFRHREFLTIRDDGDLGVAVARELASYGAKALTDEALNDIPPAWKAQADEIRALARLNGEDAQSALDIAASDRANPKLALVAVKAHERLNDRTGMVAAIKSAIRDGAADAAFADAAWRAGDWDLAVNAFDMAPPRQRKPDSAARAALAALNGGAVELPSSAYETLKSDPAALAAVAHMFKPAPRVNVRAIDVLSDFARGVTSEKNFMETGLAGLDLGAGGE